MKLRSAVVVAVLAVGILTASLAGAQQTRTFSVGYVAPSPRPTAITNVFRGRLAELGYVEGRNLVIEYGDVSIAAARRISAMTPVVFVNAHEPVRLGLVQSLAHPGGNMTGISNAEMPGP